jgi:hypothetical protein
LAEHLEEQLVAEGAAVEGVGAGFNGEHLYTTSAAGIFSLRAAGLDPDLFNRFHTRADLHLIALHAGGNGQPIDFDVLGEVLATVDAGGPGIAFDTRHD